MATMKACVANSIQFANVKAKAGLNKRSSQPEMCDAIATGGRNTRDVKVTHTVSADGGNVTISLDGKEKYGVRVARGVVNKTAGASLYKWADSPHTKNTWLYLTDRVAKAFDMTPVDEKYSLDDAGKIFREDNVPFTMTSSCDMTTEACRATPVVVVA